MYAIEMRNITMAFGSFKANDDITIRVKKGDVHALIGENGAGKSTLMSVLFGLYKQTSGQILVNERPVEIDSPLIANELGIGMVHQHFKLVEDFTTLQNIVLNSENTIGKVIVTYKEARKKVIEIMDKYNFHIDLDKKISDCSVAEQQRTEILKMLYRDAEILIFDEPTAVLSPVQIDEFLKAIKDLQTKGKTIIIITHKLDELKKVASVGTIIRRGKYIGDVDIKKITHQQLADKMVGSKVASIANKHMKIDSNPIVEISNLSVAKIGKKGVKGLLDFNLKIKAGEIVAIAGVEGNGQSEIINSITGLQAIEKGTIKLLTSNSAIFKKEANWIFKNKKYSTEDYEKWLIQKNGELELLNLEYSLKKNDAIKEKIIKIKGELAVEKVIKNSPELKIKDFPKWRAKTLKYIAKIQNNKHKISLFKKSLDKSNEIMKLKLKIKIAKLENEIEICDLIQTQTREVDKSYKNITNNSIKNKYKMGMAHIPEDRHKFGLVLDMNLNYNTILQDYYHQPFSSRGIIKMREVKKYTNEIVRNFDVRSSNGTNSLARSMSGGNQQKFIVARELSKKSSFIIIAQPTRGLDVGAITNIHSYILKAKAAGKAILLISYELDEIISLADRIVVVNSGKIVGERQAKGVTKLELGALMAGTSKTKKKGSK